MRAAVRALARVPRAAAASAVAAGVAAYAVADAEPAGTLPLSPLAPPPPQALKEYRTGLEFPLVRRDIPGASRESFLLGANVRCMLGWCQLAIARGYAFGLYADDAALVASARAASPTAAVAAGLATAGGASGGGSGDPTTALLDAKQGDTTGESGELCLVLLMARDIAGGHLGHGFSNSVLARLKQLAAREGRAGAAAAIPAPNRAAALATGQAAAAAATHGAAPSAEAAAALATAPVATAASGSGGSSSSSSSSTAADEVAEVNALAAAFSRPGVPDFRVGDEVAFVWRPDGTMAVSSRGAVLPLVLRQRRVIRALFDVYAGPSPVSPRGKATFDANLAAIGQAAVVVQVAPPAAAAAAPAALADDGLFASLKARAAALRSAAPPPQSSVATAQRPSAVDAAAVVSIVAAEHGSRSK
jgi:hypothetical protein